MLASPKEELEHLADVEMLLKALVLIGRELEGLPINLEQFSGTERVETDEKERSEVGGGLDVKNDGSSERRRDLESN